MLPLLPAAGGAALFDFFALDCSFNAFNEGAVAGSSSTEEEVEEEMEEEVEEEVEEEDVDDVWLGLLALACEMID